MKGIKVLSISRTNLAKTTVCHPVAAQEQSQIAQFFTALDHFISVSLKNLKI
jgi:type I restriction enzyme S subunit